MQQFPTTAGAPTSTLRIERPVIEKVRVIIREVKEVSDFLERVIKECSLPEAGAASVSHFITHSLVERINALAGQVSECSRTGRCNFGELNKINTRIDDDIGKLKRIFRALLIEEKRGMIFDTKAINKERHVSAFVSRPDVFSLKEFHASFEALIQVEDKKLITEQQELRKRLKEIYEKIKQTAGVVKVIVKIKNRDLDGDLKTLIKRQGHPNYSKLKEDIRKLSQAVNGLNSQAIVLAKLILGVKGVIDQIAADRDELIEVRHFMEQQYAKLERIFNAEALAARAKQFA